MREGPPSRGSRRREAASFVFARPRPGAAALAFGTVSVVITFRVIAACLLFAAAAPAADRSALADQLIGRWESVSFVVTNRIMPWNRPLKSTNEDDRCPGVEDKAFPYAGPRQRNLILCIYNVKEYTNLPAAYKAPQASLDVGLFFKDNTGRERTFEYASGHAGLGPRNIMFHAPWGYEFSYALTNDLLLLEKLACCTFDYDTNLYKVRIKAALKKTSPDPGDESRVWRLGRDDLLTQQLTGKWRLERSNVVGVLAFQRAGTFSGFWTNKLGPRGWRFDGEWEVVDGSLVEKVNHASYWNYTNDVVPGRPKTNEITIDDRELRFADDPQNKWIRTN